MPESLQTGIGALLLASYIVWMLIGMFWSMTLMQRIAWQQVTRWRLVVCFILNWLLWPIGMLHSYRRIKRNREGEGRIVF